MVRKFVSALLSTLVALASVSAASAQTGPSGPITPSLAGNASAAPAPAIGALTEEAIVAYLKTLDPNVQMQRLPNCNQYELKFARDGWNYHLQVQVNPSAIWLLCHLGNAINESQAPPANLLFQLMQISDKMGPTYFSYEKFDNGYKLCLNRQVDRRISVERLKNELELFVKNIKESYPTWNAVITARK